MVVVYTCTVEHECTVGQTCTVKQPLLNYVQWNNGVEFPITSNYKFRSGAKGSALVSAKIFEPKSDGVDRTLAPFWQALKHTVEGLRRICICCFDVVCCQVPLANSVLLGINFFPEIRCEILTNKKTSMNIIFYLLKFIL